MQSAAILIHNTPTAQDVLSNEQLYGQYTMASANLANFLPSIDANTHLDIFVNILRHQQASKLEQGNISVLNRMEIEGLSTSYNSFIQNTQCIFCTFHTGSYRLINTFLAKTKIPYTLVIANSILTQEGDDYLAQYSKISGIPEIGTFKLLDAENPQSMLKMLRELKGGRSLLFYLDGNSGSGEATINNNNSLPVNFLAQKLMARKGIGYLSHATGVPIVPVISYRNSNAGISLRFFEPIYPDMTISREEFAQCITQQLYDLAAPIIEKYPDQWESWLYLQRVAITSTIYKATPIQQLPDYVQFNIRHYGVLKVDGTPFLLQKDCYNFYPIDDALYNLLSCGIPNKLSRKQFPKILFQELCEHQVLL